MVFLTWYTKQTICISIIGYFSQKHGLISGHCRLSEFIFFFLQFLNFLKFYYNSKHFGKYLKNS